MKKFSTIHLFWFFGLLFSIHLCFGQVIPIERTTTWNPGLNAVGGIPDRTTIYATLSPSGSDDTQFINEALKNCPSDQVVKLAEGTFKISGSGIRFESSGVTLRGTLGTSGELLTRIERIDLLNFNVITIGHDLKWATSDHFPLMEDVKKGDYTVTLALPAPDLAVGELVVINILTNELTYWNPVKSPEGHASRGWMHEYDRPIGQALEVASISGNQVTFTTPLHIDFNMSDQPLLIQFKTGANSDPYPSPTQWSGMENVYIALGRGGDSGGNIGMIGTKYCWVKNIESDRSLGGSIHLNATFRCEIRDSYFHSTIHPYNGGGGYGIGLNWYAADNLIENNISWNFNKVMVMRGTGGGNVIGYNYMQDGWGGTYPDFVESGINASHMTTPHFELFEGNEAFNYGADATWGGSVYITLFRNHLTASRLLLPPLETWSYTPEGKTETWYCEDGGNRMAIGLGAGHYYYAILGNILGDADMQLLTNPRSMFGKVQTAWVYESDGQNGHVPMWNLLGADNDAKIYDPKVRETVYRHGNYDYATKSTIWDSTNSDHNLPKSLYLKSKPSFLGSLPWPLYTPENESEPVKGVLPAKARFDSVMGNINNIKIPSLDPSSSAVLLQNFPNPFINSTEIAYQVITSGSVKLKIYDISGREIITLVNEKQPEGTYHVTWNGRNCEKQKVCGGVYFYQLIDANGYAETKMMVLTR